jgi:hypothetical protein
LPREIYAWLVRFIVESLAGQERTPARLRGQVARDTTKHPLLKARMTVGTRDHHSSTDIRSYLVKLLGSFGLRFWNDSACYNTVAQEPCRHVLDM